MSWGDPPMEHPGASDIQRAEDKASVITLTGSLFDEVISETYKSREAWRVARKSMVGASDTAGIFGVGYADQSQATVWDDKVSVDQADAFADDKRLLIGQLMEPGLSKVFAFETGLKVIEPGDFTIFRHPNINWLGATLDRIAEHDEYGYCPVELKNVSSFNRDEWDNDEGPLKYNVQVQHQLAVTGASHGFLFGLIGGNEPIFKLVERNDRFIDAMLKKLEEFWGYVQRREIPPIDESNATAKLLNKLWPHDSGATVDLPAEADQWDKQLQKSKRLLKRIEAKKKAAENQIKAAIGDATFGQLPNGEKYSWKTQRRAEHVVKESEFRVLRKAKS